MIEDIELPHLPECLLNLPLETLHDIQSHTYHAIKADRQSREDQFRDAVAEALGVGTDGSIYADSYLIGLTKELADFADYGQQEDAPSHVPSDDIDIKDVREYLDAWGCLAHPGVVALLARYGRPATPAQESEYAALEKEHLGCPEKSTGIYAAPDQEVDPIDIDNEAAANQACNVLVGLGYAWNGKDWVAMLAAAPKFGEEE